MTTATDTSSSVDWGTSGENWAVFAIALILTVITLALAAWLAHLGRMISGSTDVSDWPAGLGIGAILGAVAAIAGGIITLVAYIVLVASGALTPWTLLLPAAGVVYAVRYVNAWAAGRAEQRRDQARRDQVNRR